MPFDEEDPKEYVPKTGVKQVSGQKSMFDGRPRPPTQQEFEQKVHTAHEKQQGYNKRAGELYIRFAKTMADKTLPQNRNILNNETERELLTDIIGLAKDIRDDANEEAELGPITCIILLLRTCLSQRDRINELEYSFIQLQKKLDTSVLSDFITKEIAKALDKKKDSE